MCITLDEPRRNDPGLKHVLQEVNTVLFYTLPHRDTVTVLLGMEGVKVTGGREREVREM